ncbi:MAG: flagellar filament capping protein FliD [Planctomycetota bacterium]|nr:flagellar filament capping protein FliD [Planctomycetota bacterium]
MSSIRSTVGLNSGIDIAGITSQLISLQRAPARVMEARIDGYKGLKLGIEALETNVLQISSAVNTLNLPTTFKAVTTTNSDTSQLTVSANADATLGSYAFQTLRLATAEQRTSKGFANSDEQKIGAGTLTFSQGGKLSTSTRLDTFNGGEAVQRGSIKITDRSGASATIDLTKAYTIDDVLNAINEENALSVTASTSGGQIILTDSSGSTTSNLTVEEVGTGTTATDLGIQQSVAASTLTGSEVYYLTEDFTLDQLNDGNGVFQFDGADDLRFTTTDGTQIDVNLDDVFDLGELVSAINDDASNGGKLTASLSNGRLVLTDNAGGGGTLTVEDINQGNSVEALGLDNAAVGNTLTGDRLLAGLGSKLIRNLNGGQGITTPGSITVTDRSGLTATLDLSNAESLDEVLNAINSAIDDSTSDALSLTARYNELGTGIEVVDSSGATASNLIIADVGGGSVAADLGLTVDAASTSVDSGSLGVRRVGLQTSLKDFTADGESVASGSFLITDSAGNQQSIAVSSTSTTIGDILQRINAASNIQVTARLNDTGDGFVIEDNAAGAGSLTIEEVGSTTAADLRILGTGVVGSGGNQEISARDQTVITIDADDTLKTLVDKINDADIGVSAGFFNDGSAFNSFRLSLTSGNSGAAGSFIIDDGNLDLGLTVATKAQDALLQVGSTPATSFLIGSSTNQFDEVASGVSVTARAVGTSAANVNIDRDDSKARNAIKTLVAAYNSYITTTDQLTKFDEDPTKRGILQGQGIVLRVSTRLSNLINKSYFGSNEAIQNLSDLGVRTTDGGKLEFDESVFNDVVEATPDAVQKFFRDENNGVAARFKTTLETLTDSFTGTFTNEKNGLDNSISALENRVEQIDEVLAIRQDRLLRQFIQMEEIIGQLQTQGESIAALLSSSNSSK